MKVTAISPHREGNTYHALARIGGCLGKNGIDFEIIHVGAATVRGCIACGECGKRRNGRCVFDDDPVNESLSKMSESGRRS